MSSVDSLIQTAINGVAESVAFSLIHRPKGGKSPLSVSFKISPRLASEVGCKKTEFTASVDVDKIESLKTKRSKTAMATKTTTKKAAKPKAAAAAPKTTKAAASKPAAKGRAKGKGSR